LVDNIALARGYKLEPLRSDFRLSEYRRLCLTWRRPSEQPLVEANVEKLLPSGPS
jgi:hypothetical protein